MNAVHDDARSEIRVMQFISRTERVKSCHNNVTTFYYVIKSFYYNIEMF
jgi:hypothetical protein